METHIYESKRATSERAAERAASLLADAIDRTGEASFVAAGGASQFDFLDALTATDAVDWSKTTMYMLDEYVGLSADHPASLQQYMQERVLDEVDPGTVHFIRGDADDPQAECDRLGAAVEETGLDAAFIGFGENGHLAFNDPPADFETDEPYMIVDLDDTSKAQVTDEGWFDDTSEVPDRAITMTIPQIMAADRIVCTVPHERKAEAVRACLEEDISPENPGSILRNHDRADVYLDTDSAALLSESP
jgi:glucosamine-6-phosphate deaminase